MEIHGDAWVRCGALVEPAVEAGAGIGARDPALVHFVEVFFHPLFSATAKVERGQLPTA